MTDSYLEQVIKPGDRASKLAKEVCFQSFRNSNAIDIIPHIPGNFRGPISVNWGVHILLEMAKLKKDAAGNITDWVMAQSIENDGAGGKPQFHAFMGTEEEFETLGWEIIVMTADDEARYGRLAVIIDNELNVKRITEQNYHLFEAVMRGYAPDLVFSSEDYGDPYALELGAKHILVDKERITVPISGTKLRHDPFPVWQYIHPIVRAYFAKRICVVGAESTGTTTMAKALAEHYETAWVPEFGRMYSEGKITAKEHSSWTSEEFEYIAKTQNSMEDELASQCNKVLFCDTDSFATSLWHERYMGHISEAVDRLSQNRRYDLYLLTDCDIPFVQDGTRDGEHIRHGMHQRFIEELTRRNKPYVLLSGDHKSRFKKAVEACDAVIARQVAKPQ